MTALLLDGSSLTLDAVAAVARHADAGYEEAVAFADKKGVKIPMRRKE